MRFLLLCLVVAFAGCGEDGLKKRAPQIFQDGSKGGGGSPENPSTGDADASPLLGTSAGKELLPLKITLPSVDLYFKKESIPDGAILAANEREFLWLPQKGQAGTFKLDVLDAAGAPARYEVSIATMRDDEIAVGPSAWYADGDVGFLFVHGMAQTDICADGDKGWSQWSGLADVLSPRRDLNSPICYDGRARVDSQAKKVAKQILDAPCGMYGRCVVVTHSMGGLMLEYILLRARDGGNTTAEDRALYRSVREKVAFVVSIASAAGGSKVANIVINPDRYPNATLLASVVKPFLASGDAIQTLQIDYATHVGAPIDIDPGVPFFMVPGYSTDEGIGAETFNGQYEFGVIDAQAGFQSRSDGLVSFRSSCGVASDKEDDGPGRYTGLSGQYQYCFGAPKKPSHHPWFSINLNHTLIQQPVGCSDSLYGCVVHKAKPGGGYEASPELTGKDVPHIMRRLIFR